MSVRKKSSLLCCSIRSRPITLQFKIFASNPFQNYFIVKMDEGRSNKSKWIRRQFQTSGVQLEPAALNRLIDIIDLVDNPKALIQNVLDEIENGKSSFNALILRWFQI